MQQARWERVLRESVRLARAAVLNFSRTDVHCFILPAVAAGGVVHEIRR